MLQCWNLKYCFKASFISHLHKRTTVELLVFGETTSLLRNFKASANCSCMFLSGIRSALTLNVSSKAANLPLLNASICVSTRKQSTYTFNALFLFLHSPFFPPSVDKKVIRSLCVWAAELNCCIPAGCTQVLLNLPFNIHRLSKQLWIRASRESHREVLWVSLWFVFEGVWWVFC